MSSGRISGAEHAQRAQELAASEFQQNPTVPDEMQQSHERAHSLNADAVARI